MTARRQSAESGDTKEAVGLAERIKGALLALLGPKQRYRPERHYMRGPGPKVSQAATQRKPDEE